MHICYYNIKIDIDNVEYLMLQHVVPLDMKGCICQSGRYTLSYPRERCNSNNKNSKKIMWQAGTLNVIDRE